MNKKGYC